VALLPKIGDGGNILITHIPLEKDDEMFVGDMGSTYLSRFLIGIGHADQLTRNVA
jgi:hypothetical protein